MILIIIRILIVLEKNNQVNTADRFNHIDTEIQEAIANQ